MNFSEKKVFDFIKLYKGVLSKDFCKKVIDSSVNSWYKNKDGNFYNNQSVTDNFNSNNYVDEFEKTHISKILLLQLYPILDEYVIKYQNDLSIEPKMILANKSHTLLNKYKKGEQFKKHVDHVYTLFDGAKRGIPILTTVSLMNNDFTGGNFVFGGNYQIDFEVGDLLIFPSIFIYEHEVTRIHEGTRYSLSTWIY